MGRDLVAFTEFVAARSTALVRTSLLLSAGDRMTAESNVQTALARTYVRWRGLDEWSREPYARTQLARLSTSPSSGFTPTPDVEPWRFLGGLTPRQRAVAVLRHEGQSVEQVAASLGCSPATVLADAVPVSPASAAALERAVDEVSIDDAFVLDILDAAARQVGRSRRRTTLATGLVAAVAVAVVSVGGGSGAVPVPPTPTPTPTPTFHYESGFEWARGLPPRETVLAFTLGGRLFTAAGVFEFPSDVRLVSQGEHAWLVDTAGSLVLVRPHDRIVLPGEPARGGALSPDGTLLAYDRGVVNLQTGSSVSLPDNVERVTGWDARGVGYVDARGREWLWEPGARPVRGSPIGRVGERTDLPARWGRGADELVRFGHEVYAVFLAPGTSPGERGAVVVRCWTHPPGGFITGTGCSRVAILMPLLGDQVILGTSDG